MADKQSARDKLINRVKTRLGNNLVEIDLNTIDFTEAIDYTLEKYRELSVHSTTENFMFMRTEKDQNSYTLPEDIVEVVGVHRRTFGTGLGTDVNNEFDPFELSYLNRVLMPNGSGPGVATYYLYHQQLETAQKVFGGYIQFRYDQYTKELLLMRRPFGQEIVMLQVHNAKPEEQIITDMYSAPWILDYATAVSKKILGEAYRYVNNVPGPNGGITINGEGMISEAKEDMQDLELKLQKGGAGAEQTYGNIFIG